MSVYLLVGGRCALIKGPITGSQRSSLKVKVAITWRRFQPGHTGSKIHVIAIIFSIRAEKGTRACASQLCCRTSVNFSPGDLRPSTRAEFEPVIASLAERSFSPG